VKKTNRKQRQLMKSVSANSTVAIANQRAMRVIRAEQYWLISVELTYIDQPVSKLDPHYDPNAPVRQVTVKRNDIIMVSPAEYMIQLSQTVAHVYLAGAVPITRQDALAAQGLLQQYAQVRADAGVPDVIAGTVPIDDATEKPAAATVDTGSTGTDTGNSEAPVETVETATETEPKTGLGNLSLVPAD
jgi:hypothetical protein